MLSARSLFAHSLGPSSAHPGRARSARAGRCRRAIGALLPLAFVLTGCRPEIVPEPYVPTDAHDAYRHSLEVSGLSRAFGGIKAASDVSFTAAPGKVMSIIGPNGAGKTTVLNLVSGFYVPDAGSIRLGDAELSGQPAHQVSRAGNHSCLSPCARFDSSTELEREKIGFLEESF